MKSRCLVFLVLRSEVLLFYHQSVQLVILVFRTNICQGHGAWIVTHDVDIFHTDEILVDTESLDQLVLIVLVQVKVDHYLVYPIAVEEGEDEAKK